MKITIDTKEDSPQDIEKVIALLHELRGSTPASNVFPGPSKEASSGFVDIFGSSPLPETSKTPEKNTSTLELSSY